MSGDKSAHHMVVQRMSSDPRENAVRMTKWARFTRASSSWGQMADPQYTLKPLSWKNRCNYSRSWVEGVTDRVVRTVLHEDSSDATAVREPLQIDAGPGTLRENGAIAEDETIGGASDSPTTDFSKNRNKKNRGKKKGKKKRKGRR